MNTDIIILVLMIPGVGVEAGVISIEQLHYRTEQLHLHINTTILIAETCFAIKIKAVPL